MTHLYPETKRCGKCQHNKPREEFALRSRSKDGLQAWCKLCVKIQKKLNRKPSDPKRQRIHALKHLYSLTVEQWDQMLIDQRGRCKLCNRPMTQPHVDHCHITRRVRGLLCMKCNTTLGTVEDIGIPRIEQYLERGTFIPSGCSSEFSGSLSSGATLSRFLSSSYN